MDWVDVVCEGGPADGRAMSLSCECPSFEVVRTVDAVLWLAQYEHAGRRDARGRPVYTFVADLPAMAMD